MESLHLGFSASRNNRRSVLHPPGSAQAKARAIPHDLSIDSESGSATGSPNLAPADASQVRQPRTAQIQTPSEQDPRSPPASGTQWSGHGFSALFSTPLHRLARHNSDAHQSTPLLGLTKYFEMPPEDSVYSYFLFMPPVDQRRTKKWITPIICFAGILVIVNFCMQTMLLFVVGGHIKSTHSKWVLQLRYLTTPAWYHVIPMPYNFPAPQCIGDDSPLCREQGDGISCAPPSIHLLSDWDLLDTNKDGVWSREEAHNERLREQVQCDYGIDLASFHSSIAHNMNATDMQKGRHRDKDIFTGNGIHKAFFNWYLHKPLLCQYGDPDICGSLFKRGFFDEALRNRISADFNDVSSAVQYCNKILSEECFSILPNTYRIWRSRSETQCGEKIFGQHMYAAPHSNTGTAAEKFPMLTVSFALEDIYASTASVFFRSFFLILLVAFLSVMYLEIKNILNMFIWITTFPADEGAGQGANVVSKKAVVIRRTEEADVYEDDDADSGPEYTPRANATFSKEVFAVRFDHRMMVLAMTVLRLLLWVFLLWSGTMFLTGKPRYLNLIFDALSLVFIFEIDELLYKTMLRYEFKKDHMSIADMRVPTLTQLKGRTSVWTSILELLVVILFGWCIMQTYCNVELNPLSDALSCLCSRDGPRCVDAQIFSKAWWDEYWSMTMPAATRLITKLREL